MNRACSQNAAANMTRTKRVTLGCTIAPYGHITGQEVSGRRTKDARTKVELSAYFQHERSVDVLAVPNGHTQGQAK